MEWLTDQLAFMCDVTIANRFCDDLYSKDLYFLLFTLCLTSSFISALIFYKLIDSPSFRRWYHWVFILLANFVVCFAIGWVVPQQNLLELGYEILDYLASGFEWGFMSMPLFFLISLGMRYISRNCRTVPF